MGLEALHFCFPKVFIDEPRETKCSDVFWIDSHMMKKRSDIIHQNEFPDARIQDDFGEGIDEVWASEEEIVEAATRS